MGWRWLDSWPTQNAARAHLLSSAGQPASERNSESAALRSNMNSTFCPQVVIPSAPGGSLDIILPRITNFLWRPDGPMASATGQSRTPTTKASWANGPQESAQGAARNEQALGLGDNAPSCSRPRSEGAQERRRTGLHRARPPCPQAMLSRAHSGRDLCARRVGMHGSQGSTRRGSACPGLNPSHRWCGRGFRQYSRWWRERSDREPPDQATP